MQCFLLREKRSRKRKHCIFIARQHSYCYIGRRRGLIDPETNSGLFNLFYHLLKNFMNCIIFTKVLVTVYLLLSTIMTATECYKIYEIFIFLIPHNLQWKVVFLRKAIFCFIIYILSLQFQKFLTYLLFFNSHLYFYSFLSNLQIPFPISLQFSIGHF